MKNRDITVIALGIAMYVVFSMFIPVRVIGNYFLCFGYLVIVIYPYLFGPLTGGLVGFLGTMLYCILMGSYSGLVGWTLGNTFIGIFLGIAFGKTKQMSRGAKTVAEIALIVISVAVAFLIIKPLFEAFVAQIPYPVRVASNMPAFLLDGLVMLVGYPLALYFDRHFNK